MAYFANGSEGVALDDECDSCIYGHEQCPVYAVQNLYNYDGVEIKKIRELLNMLVKDDGTCEMKKLIKQKMEALSWKEK